MVFSLEESITEEEDRAFTSHSLDPNPNPSIEAYRHLQTDHDAIVVFDMKQAQGFQRGLRRMNAL